MDTWVLRLLEHPQPKETLKHKFQIELNLQGPGTQVVAGQAKVLT